MDLLAEETLCCGLKVSKGLEELHGVARQSAILDILFGDVM